MSCDSRRASGVKNFGHDLVGGALALAAVLESHSAWAGGSEIPDNGTQAVGRGAAFVAKADDGTAIYHNPAGLARQRGTNLLVNGNLFLHSFEFQRVGRYPDDQQDPETPWGGARYPLAQNVGGPFFAPFVALTTDFGYFDRVTLAAGIFRPPVIGNRTFSLSADDRPSASRYDFVQSRSSMLFPTASLGFRLTPWLDLGVSTHLVLSELDETNVAYEDVSAEACKNVEYFRCDSKRTLNASAKSVGATIGAMLRPSASIAFGASFRTPINITARGTLTPETPKALDGQTLATDDAQLALQLPWMLRVGGRYIGMDADFELYDLEVDVTYEAWGVSQKLGPILTVPKLGTLKDIETIILHGYSDTIGIRAGGAYNFDIGGGTLSLRAGAYFDSSATDFRYTRLDYDTLAKVAGTFGFGVKLGSFGFDVGYAAVASIQRVVGSGVGEIRPVNDLKQGQTIGFDDKSLPAVNEGAYRGFTHIVSAGITLSIDGLFGPQRRIHYGNSYEPNYVGEDGDEKPVETGEKPEEKKPEEKKPEEKKPEEKKPEEKKPEEKKPEEKKPEEKKPEEKKPEEKKPEEKKPLEPVDTPPPLPPKPPETNKKPPPKDEKPPTKRSEWWEETD